MMKRCRPEYTLVGLEEATALVHLVVLRPSDCGWFLFGIFKNQSSPWTGGLWFALVGAPVCPFSQRA